MSTDAFGLAYPTQGQRRLLFSTALAVCAVLTGKPIGTGEGKTDHEALQGTWKVVELELNGRHATEKLREAITFVIAGDKMTLAGPKGIGKRHYSFKLDSTKKPKTIDLTALDGPGKDLTVPAIYELKDGVLRLCLPNSETNVRPRSFKSWEGSDRGVFKLKRTKSQR